MSMEPESTDDLKQVLAPPSPDLGEEFATGEEGLIVAEERTPISRSTLVMFAVLVIGAAGLFLMHRKTGPKNVAASVSKETVAASKTISSFLSGGDVSIRSMEKLLRNTEKVVQQFLAYPSMTQIPLSDLRTNPFRQHMVQDQAAADATRRDDNRQAILKAVQSLRLESIMYSDTRKACMVNDKLYREGETFENFTVERITPASVIVKNGPYRFELRIQR